MGVWKGLSKSTLFIIIVVIILGAVGIYSYTVYYSQSMFPDPTFEQSFMIHSGGAFCEETEAGNAISVVLLNTCVAYPLEGEDFILRLIQGPTQEYVIQESEFPVIEPTESGMLTTLCGNGCESGNNTIRLATAANSRIVTAFCP